MTPEPRATGAATAALTGLTVAAALGMGRLFAGQAHVVPFLAAALVIHTVMWGGRRLQAPLPVTAGAALAALALVTTWTVVPETTTFGLPLRGTLDAVGHALGQSWREFGEVVAPAPVTDGFLVAGMIGIGVTAVLADWAAFRMGALFEAVLPSFTLFLFTATLGASGGRSLLWALYVGALMTFLLVHQAGLLETSWPWFASRSRDGPAALLRRGAALGVVTVTAGLVLGPALPGAGEPALLAWRDTDRGSEDGRRTTVSPLVDIRNRLVNQSRTELFAVRATQRAYWRLTSLDTFDGRIWSSDATHEPVGRRLPRGVSGDRPAERVVQEFSIASLSSLWLPAAYRPERVEGVDDVSYNDDLGSLVTGRDSSDGLTYRVESALPRLSATELRRPGPRLDPEQAGRFLALPLVSPRVTALARAIAAEGRGSTYGTALALQRFFRSGGFAYDLTADQGHGDRALETFLFRTRRGYCEQFAGAYAVMARAVGLPTRVAVGFTPGELGADGRFHVRGLNAHAWPEVYVNGAGWVAFEPTPGRGAPGAEAYTGVPEQQARPENPSTATTAAPTTSVAPGPAASSTTTAVTPAGRGAADEADGDRRTPLRHPLVLVGLSLVVLMTCLGVGVPALKAARRRRYRRAATTGSDRVLVEWDEVTEALAGAGAPRRAADTLDEHARRAAAAVPLPDPASAALRTLAGDAAAASYSGAPLPPEVASRASGSAAVVKTALRASSSRLERLRRAVDPRPLGRPPARRDARRG